MGTTCVRLTSPTVGFNPTIPLIAAGQVTEPSVSVPIASRTSPAATAAPDPLDDPHELRLSAHGLRAWPPTALHPEIERVERMFAHSLRLVLPTMTAPAARRRATSGASRFVTLFASARLPAVVGKGPAASILSLISTGCPASGPRSPLESIRRAWSMAVGSTAITEWSFGSIRAMRSSAARTFASAGKGAGGGVPEENPGGAAIEADDAAIAIAVATTKRRMPAPSSCRQRGARSASSVPSPLPTFSRRG